jgi:uncharacterized membrane protein
MPLNMNKIRIILGILATIIFGVINGLPNISQYLGLTQLTTEIINWSCSVIIIIVMVWQFLDNVKQGMEIDGLKKKDNENEIFNRFNDLLNKFGRENVWFDSSQYRSVVNPVWYDRLHDEFNNEEVQWLINKGIIDENGNLISYSPNEH